MRIFKRRRRLVKKGLTAAVKRAISLYRQPAVWKNIALAGLRQSSSFAWRQSAIRYFELYRQLIAPRQTQ